MLQARYQRIVNRTLALLLFLLLSTCICRINLCISYKYTYQMILPRCFLDSPSCSTALWRMAWKRSNSICLHSILAFAQVSGGHGHDRRRVGDHPGYARFVVIVTQGLKRYVYALENQCVLKVSMHIVVLSIETNTNRTLRSRSR